jgi:drug/metabolite transporter (DMT)-like permease
MRTEKRLGALAALAAAVMAISWSAIFVRWARMPGVSSAFYRTLIAAPVLWAVVPVLGRARPRLSRNTIWIAVAGGIFFAGDVGFWNVAVMHTSAGNATFLSNTAPLFVGLMIWMTTGKLPSARFWMALLVGLAGTGLIVVADQHHAVSRSAADGLAMLAAVCFAAYLVITGRLRAVCDSALLLALSTSASAVTLLIWALSAHISLAVPGASSWWALAGLGLVCQVGGYFCLTYALGHLPTTVTSILWLMIAPLTGLFALMVFGERMGPLEIAGGGLVLAAIWIVDHRTKSDIAEIVEMPSVQV